MTTGQGTARTYGPVVRPGQAWDAGPTAVSPWVAESPACETSKMHVWCVEGLRDAYLPLLLRAH